MPPDADIHQTPRPATDKLTPEEIETLRRKGKEARAYFQVEFSGLKPNTVSRMLTDAEIDELRRKDREASTYAKKIFKTKPPK